MKVNKAVRNTIESADTVEKVWALVAILLQDGNNYSDLTYLHNARAYASIARQLLAEKADV